MKKHENPLSQNIINTCQLPKDVLEGAFIISMTGNTELMIENFRHILKYQPDSLILQCKKGNIHILGKNLNIEVYSKEELRIKGIISEIKFL